MIEIREVKEVIFTVPYEVAVALAGILNYSPMIVSEEISELSVELRDKIHRAEWGKYYDKAYAESKRLA